MDRALLSRSRHNPEQRITCPTFATRVDEAEAVAMAKLIFYAASLICGGDSTSRHTFSVIALKTISREQD